MLRRLSPVQPASFAFTPANEAWARAQMTKFPEGRQASAIIPILWRAQEQEGWLTRPAIEHVAQMLGMAYIRALEVATFYFMFQLQPVGRIAHIQICGTTSCMICGAEELIAVCREKIAPDAHQLSADGNFSWEEVECLGACANAPMAQIGKDYYEDLTATKLEQLIDAMASGAVPVPGSQTGRFAAEPLGGRTSLLEAAEDDHRYNASVQAAVDLRETLKRIDGTEAPLRTPWLRRGAEQPAVDADAPAVEAVPSAGAPADATGVTVQEAQAGSAGSPVSASEPAGAVPAGDAPAPMPFRSRETARQPAPLTAARESGADDLTIIEGIGPKLGALLNSLGIWHFDQIAAWDEDELAWIDDHLEGFKGRATRDDWVGQAQRLAKRSEG